MGKNSRRTRFENFCKFCNFRNLRFAERELTEKNPKMCTLLACIIPTLISVLATSGIGIKLYLMRQSHVQQELQQEQIRRDGHDHMLFRLNPEPVPQSDVTTDDEPSSAEIREYYTSRAQEHRL